jgi:hypothetical protein
MSGTDDLIPERRSRSQKMTRRSQPYRKRRRQTQGPTLSAMLKGAPQFLPNPMDAKRRMQRRGR